MTAVDVIAFLAASDQRVAVVRALRREGPMTRAELVERAEAARVTVSRNLERLQDRDLVVDEGGRYALTPVGELLAEEFLELVEVAGTAEELAQVLGHVAPEELDFDLRSLANADVTVASRADPYAPIDRHRRTLTRADEARTLLPAVGSGPMEVVVERVGGGELEIEMVVSPDVAVTLLSDTFASRVQRLFETGDYALYVYDGEVPYYLGVVDGTVQLGVDDESGIPLALLEADAQEVRTWAEETYRRYRTAATSIEDVHALKEYVG